MQYHAALQKNLNHGCISSGLNGGLLFPSGHVKLVVRHPFRPGKVIAYKINAAWPQDCRHLPMQFLGVSLVTQLMDSLIRDYGIPLNREPIRAL